MKKSNLEYIEKVDITYFRDLKVAKSIEQDYAYEGLYIFGRVIDELAQKIKKGGIKSYYRVI